MLSGITVKKSEVTKCENLPPYFRKHEGLELKIVEGEKDGYQTLHAEHPTNGTNLFGFVLQFIEYDFKPEQGTGGMYVKLAEGRKLAENEIRNNSTAFRRALEGGCLKAATYIAENCEIMPEMAFIQMEDDANGAFDYTISMLNRIIDNMSVNVEQKERLKMFAADAKPTSSR